MPDAPKQADACKHGKLYYYPFNGRWYCEYCHKQLS